MFGCYTSGKFASGVVGICKLRMRIFDIILQKPVSVSTLASVAQ